MVTRNLDLMMLAQFNFCERTAKSWELLLQDADPRFRLNDIITPKRSLMSIIEAVWVEDS